MKMVSGVGGGGEFVDPRLLGADHFVEGHQDFAHAGDEGDFLELGGRFGGAFDQPQVKRLDDGTPSDGGERGHVQDSSNFTAASPDAAFAFELSAVVVVAGQADQREALGSPLRSRRARPLVDREQTPLAVGRDVPRRSIPPPRRLRRHDLQPAPPRRSEPPEKRSFPKTRCQKQTAQRRLGRKLSPTSPLQFVTSGAIALGRDDRHKHAQSENTPPLHHSLTKS